jgi:hypothetical protein
LETEYKGKEEEVMSVESSSVKVRDTRGLPFLPSKIKAHVKGLLRSFCGSHWKKRGKNEKVSNRKIEKS